MKRKGIAVLILGTALISCDRAREQEVAPSARYESPPQAVERKFDPAVVERGAKLYKENCAVCHGDTGQGAPNWATPGVTGPAAAPPLDGSGHAWHHTTAQLKQTIRQGTIRLGGSMPPWEGKLSESEIDSILAWMKSRWPEEIYRAWQSRESGGANNPSHQH